MVKVKYCELRVLRWTFFSNVKTLMAFRSLPIWKQALWNKFFKQYRIYLTHPVSVASFEWSFIKVILLYGKIFYDQGWERKTFKSYSLFTTNMLVYEYYSLEIRISTQCSSTKQKKSYILIRQKRRHVMYTNTSKYTYTHRTQFAFTLNQPLILYVICHYIHIHTLILSYMFLCYNIPSFLPMRDILYLVTRSTSPQQPHIHILLHQDHFDMLFSLFENIHTTSFSIYKYRCGMA